MGKISDMKKDSVKWVSVIAAGFLCFLIFSLVCHTGLGLISPKTAALRRANSALRTEIQLLDHRMDGYREVLQDIVMREQDVYRPIFGMDSVSTAFCADVYEVDSLEALIAAESASLREVEAVSLSAGEMAARVPNFNPVNLSSRSVCFSSPFGYRVHPITGETTLHTGIDFGGPIGEPVYATGDGVVESVDINFYGYGNCILIDHGFGYKTRYGHLRIIHVHQGQKLHRGDQIATIGNSGRTTGSHLHYEVIYMGRPVNPGNYLNEGLAGQEFLSMVHPVEEGFRL